MWENNNEKVYNIALFYLFLGSHYLKLLGIYSQKRIRQLKKSVLESPNYWTSQKI